MSPAAVYAPTSARRGRQARQAARRAPPPPADGDWAGVIDRVAGELRQWAAERPVQSPSATPKRAAKA